MTTGPTQLVVLGFDRLDRFRGQVLAELQAVRGRDVIRLLDLLVVTKDQDGRVTTLDLSDLDGPPALEDDSAAAATSPADHEQA